MSDRRGDLNSINTGTLPGFPIEAHDVDQSKTIKPSLLCLKCRQAGHIVDKCPSSQWFDELGWFFSPARKILDFGDATSFSQQELCARCRDLDLLHFLHEEIPWKSPDDIDQIASSESKYIRSLGQTGSIEFWKNCPLCRCLFALTPIPSSTTQTVLILPNWTITRLEGVVAVDTEDKRRYAKCLLVGLDPSSLSSLPFSDRTQRGDALCIVEEDDFDYATTLGGRSIDPDHLSINIIEEWLSSCDRLHRLDCSRVWTQDLLDIRLVDVSTWEIVKYPEERCDYLALSYVWGGVPQQCFRLGSILGKLPQTIEDTIAFAQRLGKRYFWVDSLCIDQSDDRDKLHQIERMSIIYRGAYATIIALSGESADAGLPRLGPNVRICPQLTCCIDGKRLVGLMPTLSQLIWVAPWARRAWTLQEALLSPRCLYISDYQIYFECNAMQCSESLDQTKSWVHQVCRDPKPTKDWTGAEIGAGVLRSPFQELSPTNERMGHFGSRIILYSYRSMTSDLDGLNAFSGILQYFEPLYPEGFFFGLPVEDFQWALLWRSQSPPRRRISFPTWSWAGWEGALWPMYPSDMRNPRQFQPYLRIWKAQWGQLVPLFQHDADTDMKDLEILFKKDPVGEAARLDSQDPDLDIGKYTEAQTAGYLFAEAIVFQFVPDYSTPLIKVCEKGRVEVFRILISGVNCGIEIISTDSQITSHAKQEKQEFLLLARDRKQGMVYHHLLLLCFKEGLAERGTVLSLLVPENRLDVLEVLEPRKRRVVLS